MSPDYHLYDAEGRICAVNGGIYGGMTGYLYDAAGNRVAKGSILSMSCDVTQNGFQQQEGFVVGPSGEQLTEIGADNTVWHHTNIYAGGKLIGTYDTSGLHFHIDDPLGTRRVQVNASGQIEAEYQSLPFGDGLTTYGTAADPTENHFTGKERDAESGNDYMFARYYNSATGRFLSPDWSAKYEPVPYAKLDNPQSLNLYSYVYNNPLGRVDPDGHETAQNENVDTDDDKHKAKDKKLTPPDAQHNHKLIVREVSGQGVNGFGHVTVQLDGGDEVGYGPKKDMTGKEVAHNTAVPGKVEPRAANAHTEDEVTINISADQAKAVQATIDAVTHSPGNYKEIGNSCVNFGEQVVRSAGAPSPNATRPSELIGDIRAQQYHDNTTQTPQ